MFKRVQSNIEKNTQKNIEMYIERALKIAIGLFFIAFPLIFFSKSIENFEFPKVIFLYVTAPTLFSIFVVSVLKNKSFKKIPKQIIAFYIIFVVTTVTSSHLYTSVFGYFSRFNGGLLSMLAFFMVYLLLLNFYNNKDFENLKKWVIFGSIPVSLYAIFQQISINVQAPVDEYIRIYSTLGQPNWLGAYLALVIIFAWSLFIETKGKKAFYFGFVIFIALMSILFTASLSTVLALFCAFGFIVYKSLKTKKISKKVFLLIIPVFLFFLFQPQIWKVRIVDTIKSINLLEKNKGNMSKIDQEFTLSDSGLIRAGMWEGALKLFLKSPKNILLGTGPETFPYEFQKTRPAYLNYTSEWDFILNKPHNYYLELLSSMGILGFGVYLWLLAYAFKKSSSNMKPFFIIIAVTNFFSWPVSVINLLFWGFLAENENN